LAKVKDIELLKQILESKFPQSIFIKRTEIEYETSLHIRKKLIPALYENDKKLVVIIDDVYDADLISDLYRSGFTPLVYSNQDILYLRQSPENVNDPKANNLKEQINIYSSTEVDDLIEKTPGWLMRSGIMLITIVTLSIILFSSLLKYPDKIVCRGVLTSDNPPVVLKSKVEGRIEQMFASTGDTVAQGQRIIYIQNTANLEDVSSLKILLENLINEDGSITDGLSIPGFLSLGMMQEDFGRLQLAYQSQQQIINQDATSLTLSKLEREISYIEELNQKLGIQVSASQMEKSIIIKEVERNKSLLKEGLISEQDLEKSQLALNQFDQSYEQLQKEIINNNIKTQELSLQRSLLTETNTDEIRSSENKILELWDRLNTTLRSWEDIYFINSDRVGIVELPTAIEENKIINTQTEIGTILSKKSDSLSRFISAQVPSYRRGKIKDQSKAIIKFDAYPYKEFGYYISTVDRIAVIPEYIDNNQNSFYEAMIKVDDNVTSEYKQELILNPGMTVTVEIITDDRSLLFRIMDSLTFD